jgi:hypothetical protein
MQPEKKRVKLAVFENRESFPASPKVSEEDVASLGDLALRSFAPEEPKDAGSHDH